MIASIIVDNLSGLLKAVSIVCYSILYFLTHLGGVSRVGMQVGKFSWCLSIELG